STITEYLLGSFPDADPDIRREQVRLLGEYQISQGFPKLLTLLETERDEVTQFHIAQAVSKLPAGWTPGEEGRLLRWMLGTQQGWFAQFGGKGVEFPLFLQTVLGDFARNHANALLNGAAQVDLGSLLGSVMIDLIARSPKPEEKLLDLYRGTERPKPGRKSSPP
ncbi:MAG TPA: HEAT repeat domain-containing protein, partial [Candidatus Angelobacter sp.]|nr:HEAT repeat domain-containing protein [Candidatus Angelobacter sp.]